MEGITSSGLSPDIANHEDSTAVPISPPTDTSAVNPTAFSAQSDQLPTMDSALGGSTSTSPQPETHVRATVQYGDFEEGITQLPPYARSLLKIKVPVSVMLAEAKQTVDTILNIGPGSILHFNKSCEDTLALEVAGQKIAVGETVKIGDKFGLWITSIILPDERFWVIGCRENPKRAK